MNTRGIRKERTGVVTSAAPDKTVAVLVEHVFPHPMYHKTVRRTKKFLAHDEENRCRVGDRVRIVETRPLSKRKNWRVVEIVGREARLVDEPAGGADDVKDSEL